ncbi:putative methanogenesis marker protein 8 [Methanohalophilus levihalophilus]|uniref:methanogenesis marker 8 protein n=1 Tax=Methanohalophilus levihalophilus TaxID=1431282 RepID=UPI001AE6F4A3|nr:methanogenesis marker 8 protein [Methanohalophilus levihalophilus]MBP2029625.1 putative methanogenesis marker protein 8 [Methanohalophilus levihalophilus]
MPHIMEMLGKTRVVVKDGKVIEVGEPQVKWCPIFAKVHDIQEITPESVKWNMEYRIRNFGLFTPERQLEMDVFVGFGVSEVTMTAFNRGMLDATVTVCDGAGTVITSNPTLVQGMGARISGLVETEPIPEVIKGITERGGVVLDPENAKLDIIAGVLKAKELGFRSILATTIDPVVASKLREIEKEHSLDLVVVGAHVTGLSKEETQELLGYLDIITCCGSKWVRELAQPLAQVGTAVPLFALTQKGKELLLERAKEVTSPILINTMPLPALPEHKQPKDLV